MENVNLFVELALEVKRLGAELEKMKQAQSQGYDSGSFKDWVNSQIENQVDELREEIESETERTVERALDDYDFQSIFDNLDMHDKVKEEIKAIFSQF